jgi:hypothetical protein
MLKRGSIRKGGLHMARKLSLLAVLLFLLASPGAAAVKESATGVPATHSEESNYLEPTPQALLYRYLADLQRKSDCMKMRFFTASPLKREIPLVILARPAVFNPEGALSSPKLTVLIDSQIHGNEPAGTEALLILMREIAAGDLSYLLDRLIILCVPRLNPDGTSANTRANSENYDLNRDFAKLDSPEVRDFICRVIVPWNPSLVIDSHEAWARAYDFMLDGPGNLNTCPALKKMAEEGLLPAIKGELEKKGFSVRRYFVFADSRKPEEGIVQGGGGIRVGRNYLGLRNSMGLLFESSINPNQKSFLERRIRVQLEAFRAALKYAYDNWGRLKEAVRAAEAESQAAMAEGSKVEIVPAEVLEPEGDDEEYEAFPVKAETSPAGGKTKLRYEEKPVTFRAPVREVPSAGEKVERPFAYILLPGCREAAANLKAHGLAVEMLSAPLSARVEAFELVEAEPSGKYYQGHLPVKFTLKKYPVQKEFPAGSYLVPMAQPEGNLAALLLEPTATDSLLGYGYFNSFLHKGRILPVYRLMEKTLYPAVLL